MVLGRSQLGTSEEVWDRDLSGTGRDLATDPQSGTRMPCTGSHHRGGGEFGNRVLSRKGQRSDGK